MKPRGARTASSLSPASIASGTYAVLQITVGLFCYSALTHQEFMALWTDPLVFGANLRQVSMAVAYGLMLFVAFDLWRTLSLGRDARWTRLAVGAFALALQVFVLRYLSAVEEVTRIR